MQSFCFFSYFILEIFNRVEVLGAILLAIGSKAEKLLMASPSAKEANLLNTNGSISFRVAQSGHTRRHKSSIDFDGEEDIFFDCEEWPLPESETEDDFQSANGDFSPCSSSTESESSMIGMGMSMEMGMGMGLSMDTRKGRGMSMEMDMDMRMMMANTMKNKTILSKNKPPRDLLARERNLSNFFHQDHFWNYEYKYKDVERHNKEGETSENGRKLAQFLEDSYWVNQAGGVDHHKKKIFPCLPTTVTRRRPKRKPHSSFSDAMRPPLPPPPPPPQPHNDESKTRKGNMKKHSRCASCLPKAFNWLHCRGRKKLSPAPIDE